MTDFCYLQRNFISFLPSGLHPADNIKYHIHCVIFHFHIYAMEYVTICLSCIRGIRMVQVYYTTLGFLSDVIMQLLPNLLGANEGSFLLTYLFTELSTS
jgi:hypothetical protein